MGRLSYDFDEKEPFWTRRLYVQCGQKCYDLKRICKAPDWCADSQRWSFTWLMVNLFKGDLDTPDQ